MVNTARRHVLQAFAATGVLGACADVPPQPGASGASSSSTPTAGRLPRRASLTGGYVVPGLPPAAPAAAGRTGMYLRWIAPVSVALRGGDLLVADGASGRLWRADVVGGLVTGVPVGTMPGGTALLLGPDLSAWVLDAAGRQILHLRRDGRLLQTLKLPQPLLTPVAIALDDDGLTLRLADGTGARWVALRAGGPAIERAPRYADGRPLHSVDGFAPGPAGRLYVLDRLDALVHLTDDAGHVLMTLGHGELLQPVAIASDRLGRAWVHDAQDGSLKRLAPGRPVRRWSAADLGVQRIAALAIDGLALAVADPLGGRVNLYALPDEASP